MRIVHRVPVVWPDADAWQRWHADAELELDTLVADARGYLRSTDDPTGGPLGGRPDHPQSGFRLVAGTHLQLGARYHLDREDLTRGTAEVEIVPGHHGRAIRARYQEHAGLRRWTAELFVDGLDGAHVLEVRSTLRHLGLRLEMRTTAPDVLVGELELDWLAAGARAVVRRRGAGDELTLTLTARGRGRWWPLLGPVLSAAGVALRRSLPGALEEALADLSDIARGAPVSAAVKEERRRARARAELGASFDRMLADLLAIENRLDARPFWRRTRGAWRREVESYRTASPSPPRFSFRDPSDLVRDQILRLLLVEHRRTSRRRRRELLPAWVAEQHVATLRREEERWTAMAASVAAMTSRSQPSTQASRQDLDELLDLSWLASPGRALRKLKSQEGGDDAADEGDDERELRELAEELASPTS